MHGLGQYVRTRRRGFHRPRLLGDALETESCAHAGMIVVEGELRFMHPGNSGDETEPKTGPRGIAARLQAYEPFRNARTILRRNPRAVVGDHQRRTVWLVLKRN